MMSPTLCWYALLCRVLRVWNMSYKFPTSYIKLKKEFLYLLNFWILTIKVATLYVKLSNGTNFLWASTLFCTSVLIFRHSLNKWQFSIHVFFACFKTKKLVRPLGILFELRNINVFLSIQCLISCTFFQELFP